MYDTAFAVATKDSVGINTSSFGFTPASKRLICNAEVPFTVAMANLDPVNFAICISKSSTNFPTEETNVESIHSFTYFHSFP